MGPSMHPLFEPLVLCRSFEVLLSAVVAWVRVLPAMESVYPTMSWVGHPPPSLLLSRPPAPISLLLCFPFFLPTHSSFTLPSPTLHRPSISHHRLIGASTLPSTAVIPGPPTYPSSHPACLEPL
ncbi:hypothetical protein DM02DRAFT_405086 [Periconia macrospinosa]|uniref:Uncharacterized protein n=1 Tax=Periconia macrospinosa TaxID=97972 RepID=A0A2V1E948_9PLEO|nr:hypothetical protein DM02DRAFT_405086 [Periconia macrospinosa]